MSSTTNDETQRIQENTKRPENRKKNEQKNHVQEKKISLKLKTKEIFCIEDNNETFSTVNAKEMEGKEYLLVMQYEI